LIAILDYGSGNLRSAERAFALAGESLGHEVVLTSDPDICQSSDGLVLPGVGAFGACIEQLKHVGGDRIVMERVGEGKPILGICVGMQILFASGSEKGSHQGLGIFGGEVSRISAPILPHIGWNTIEAPRDSKLFQGIHEQSFYFVHSFAAKERVAEAVNSHTHYGESFIAAIELGRTSAVQFHPEKSGVAGAQLITNWIATLADAK
jgi:imidazole glycerol-phosphate synthase subunit HisH